MSANENDKVQKRAAERAAEAAASAKREEQLAREDEAEVAAREEFGLELERRLEERLAQMTSSKADFDWNWASVLVGFYFEAESGNSWVSRRHVLTVRVGDASDGARLFDVIVEPDAGMYAREREDELSLDEAVELAIDELVEAMAECVSTGARIVPPDEARERKTRDDKAFARSILFDRLLTGLVVAAGYLTASRLLVAYLLLPADFWLLRPAMIFWRWLYSLG